MSILLWVMFLKNIIKRAFIIFLCGMLFFGLAYAYLYFNFNKPIAKADQKDYTVPYNPMPENAGVAFLLPDSSAVLAFLDFENGCINVVNIEKYDVHNKLYYGYTADFTVQTDYELISGIIDRVGGINIEISGETLRYTGVQVVELISEKQNTNIKPQIIYGIFKQISKNNFSKDDFLYIIENSSSDLKLVDCIYWLEHIDNLCSRINIVN